MIRLKPGDVFCTENPMWLGRAINAVQSFWDPESESKYSHSGFIVDDCGTTSEALWTLTKSDINNYSGKQIIIGRHRCMTVERFFCAYDRIESREGQWYPLHRLPLFFLPPLAKYLHISGRAVCSEWAGKMLCEAGIFKHWAGKSPDYIADIMISWREWDVVFQGVWNDKKTENV